MSTHVIIPDTQVKPGTSTRHLEWIGQYLVDQFVDQDDVKIIHLGDHWDMPSLSGYDKGKKSMENRRVNDDIQSGNEGFALLAKPMEKLNHRRRRFGKKQWLPERHFLFGNHEERIVRAAEADAQLDGVLSLDHLITPEGWERHGFLKPVWIDGVAYSHYFYNPMSGRPYSGMIEGRLKNVGHSFTMGHQQGFWFGVRQTLSGSHHGLVAGSCYLHDEEYKGEQGNNHWRGIVVCHEVRDGSYDVMQVSLDFLSRKYEGEPLK